VRFSSETIANNSIAAGNERANAVRWTTAVLCGSIADHVFGTDATAARSDDVAFGTARVHPDSDADGHSGAVQHCPSGPDRTVRLVRQQTADRTSQQRTAASLWTTSSGHAHLPHHQQGGRLFCSTAAHTDGFVMMCVTPMPIALFAVQASCTSSKTRTIHRNGS
jgi:hypothetical protein